MKCELDGFSTDNKKSWSNHMRWHNGSMSRESFWGINAREKNSKWKGNFVGKDALHRWVYRNWVGKKPTTCGMCGLKKKLDLANISQTYQRNFTDWEWLCRRCHMLKDGRLEKLIELDRNRHA